MVHMADGKLGERPWCIDSSSNISSTFQTETEWEIVNGIISTRSWPSLIVDLDCHILSANTPAKKLLVGQSDWSVSSIDKLVHRDAYTHADLRAKIAALCGDQCIKKSVYSLYRSNGEQELLTLSNIFLGHSTNEKRSKVDNCYVLITIHDSTYRKTDVGRHILESAFSFTPAEVRLAFALMSGASPQHFADQSGIAIATVRWHLRNALSKASCSNQRELVSLLISLIDS